MDPDLEKYLLSLVDGRFAMFRQELQLELAPLKASINFHNREITKIEQTTSETAVGLARVEGTVDSLKEQQTDNHNENSGKLDALLERFNIFVGGIQGTRESTERKKHNLREWLKVAFATVSLTTLYKLIQHWWHK